MNLEILKTLRGKTSQNLCKNVERKTQTRDYIYVIQYFEHAYCLKSIARRVKRP